MDPTSSQIIGIVFVGAGILDPVLGILVVGPRVEDERARKIVIGGLLASGATMIALGVCFLAGLFGS